MAEQIHSGDKSQGSIDEIKKQVERFSKLFNYTGMDRVTIWDEYLKNKKEDDGRKIAISCGFEEMDYLLQGFQTGELVTVSGYTGMGKSLFMKSIIRSFGIQKVPTAIFSFEDSADRYVQKFADENADYPIYLPMSLRMGDMAWLEERIMESKAKYDAKVVSIDHLHYLVGNVSQKENMSLVMGGIMRKLKRIAEDMNLCILVVAHQKKANDELEEASLESIRDSGLIGNESDAVIVVQRIPDAPVKKNESASYDMGYSLVKIEKSRRTGTYRKRLTFQKKGEWLEPI